jgi:uncharacterized membrane protein
MSLSPAIFFYDVVLALHIAAIVVAFGVTFAYPILDIYVTREHPRVLPVIHGAQERIGRYLIAPAGGIALLAGFYLASDRDLFGKVWVVIPMIILIALLAAGGVFFGPSERKAQALAERDIAAAGPDGPVTFSPEYKAVAGRIALVGGIANVLILVAIFFMTAKPGGY